MQSVTYTIARPDTGAVLPYAVVTVYEQDGSTRASIFDAEGAPAGNPVTADINGSITIAAANGTYILSAVSADGELSLPSMMVQIFDLDALATAIAASGIAGVAEVKFATDATMRADLAHADGTIALVYADSDPLKNDLYYKIGASGSGSWSGSLGLMAGLSYNYANRAKLLAYLASNPFVDTTALEAYENAYLALADSTIVVGDGRYELTDLDPLTWTRTGDSDGKVSLDAAGEAANSLAAVNASLTAFTDYGATGVPIGTDPVTGTSSGNRTEIFNDPATVSRIYNQVRIYNPLGTTQTYKIKRFTLSGGVFTQAQSVSFTAAPGLSTVVLGTLLTVAAGQYIGLFGPTNALTFVSGAVENSGGRYTSSGDATSMAQSGLQTTNQFQFSLDYSYAVFDASTYQGAVSKSSELYTDQNRSALIFRPVAPSGGAAATGAATFIAARPSSERRRVTSISIINQTATAKTAKLRRFKQKGTTFEQQGTDVSAACSSATGAQTINVSLTIEPGELFAVYFPANMISQTTATSSDGDGYLIGTGDLSGTVNTSSFGYRSQVQPQIGTVATSNAAEAGNTVLINPLTSDVIMFIGDSYTASLYCPRGKHWMNEVSALTDWRLENYGVGGHTLDQRLTDLRALTAAFGNLSGHDYRPSHVVLMTSTNEQLSGMTYANLQDSIRRGIEQVRGMGAIPIVASEQTTTYGEGMTAMFRAVADEHGAHFVNVQEIAAILGRRKIYGGVNANEGTAAHWNGSHPGVRTNKFFVQAYERFLRALGRPRAGMKMFRPRAGVTISTVDSLFYGDNYDRTRLWRELDMGQRVLNAPEYYDRLDLVASNAHSAVNSEYLALMARQGCSFTDYALLEVVLPTTPAHIRRATLTIDDIGATVYIPRHLSGSMATGTPVGAWAAVPGSAGVFEISTAMLRQGMRYDKLPILIVKSGAFTLGMPELRLLTDGMVKGDSEYRRDVRKRPAGAELLTTTSFPTSGAPTGWTVTGTVAGAASASDSVPLGGVGIISVDASNYVTQTLTLTADNYQDRDMQIRVTARRRPAEFDPLSGTYPSGAPINSDSFDWTKVELGITTDIGAATPIRATQQQTVSVGWMELVFNTVWPAGLSTLKIDIRGTDQAVEIATISARLVS